MLPDHVNLILLSATVPNTLEFADWIGYAQGALAFAGSFMSLTDRAQADEEKEHLRDHNQQAAGAAGALPVGEQRAL
jgi:superfamily II RNA helicase